MTYMHEAVAKHDGQMAQETQGMSYVNNVALAQLKVTLYFFTFSLKSESKFHMYMQHIFVLQ